VLFVFILIFQFVANERYKRFNDERARQKERAGIWICRYAHSAKQIL